MLSLTLAALFTAVAIACVLTFVDCWIRGRFVFKGLQRERALLDAGFVPVVEASELRQRQTKTQAMRFDALSMPGRYPAQRHRARGGRHAALASARDAA